jgi:hypothetical protein
MQIEQMLAEKENIIWRSKPNFWVFISKSIGGIIFGLIWLGFVFGFYTVFTHPFDGATYEVNGKKVSMEEFEKSSKNFKYFFIPFFVVGGLGLLSPLGQFLAYSKEEYAITDKRLLISKGIIGKDFKAIDLNRIKNIEVNVGLLDKILGTGSILIFTGEFTATNNSASSSKDRFIGIENPYETFKLIKRV